MKIAWLTDVQAPYREPMWAALADAADFEVSFMFREEKVRHWRWREHDGYRSSLVRAWTLPMPGPIARRIDGRMAVLGPGVVDRILDGADALVIHEWWQPAYLWGILRARRKRIPYVVYAESTLQSRQFTRGVPAWLRSMVFKHAGAVIVPGPAAGEAAIADGAQPSRVVESVNSVDMEVFRRRVAELRVDTGPEAEHRFVCVGQLIPRKNVGSLICAFAGLDGRPTLDIVGDGVEMAALKAIAGEHGVADRVRFLGFLEPSDLAGVLARTQTLVLPSTEEVYGFTALEAYIAGLQVIVSDKAGIAPNFTGLHGAWIVDPSQAGLEPALKEARGQWTGWNDDVDVEFASPQRAAQDVIRAVGIARRTVSG